MKSSFIFLLLIISCVIIESSVIQPFFYPFNLISLSFIVGVLIFHAFPLSYGLSWFILLPLVESFFGYSYMPFVTYPLLGIIGYILLKRSFARRSIFGLFGFGITLYTLMLLINIIFGFNSFSFYPFFQTYSYQIVINIIILFLGFTFIQRTSIINSRDLFPG
ncbi:MAG: hypothetical protein UU40_C0002G0043 [Candidatus Uhrbacteria bacterium GW2011_GWD2_41_121]|uniref:Rod shape-determining protein MreD n=1 Tax=Candidatus Uhrbacteria bacterium GW2011_GWC1_41_20 TaxID=1618983 RepID=A0A0G0VJS4_9BACT|nr:MAG: hypothetical protein UT52_C0002G0043 [Candidatus Uhrbacteria bacterium GW2011_GWE1_39_46]KKR64526.1 MAG: hypothetical protein UU04_C0001G0043 [Candidatus Uhrbacteria bacterium GW2011_GWC2_40_450]KKR90598.1 MAG: hypothetical protein UU40_C0002G0043 [Candidatus Uhrbacteria bacterium GW2011_GWD2_41_121]KKR90814.1 MAG: hypothetical protein UU36_C0001G0019 [Candidatus Uhrbacteria bacterium GW2011_GWE2_41_1153]KKR96509.1 MAG: hypothetical protein UU46_C0002G0045 [Candidatus Uhrbacteria bacter